MTLIISMTGHSVKEILARLAKITVPGNAITDLAEESGFATLSDGNTINHQYHRENFESLAAYHNSLMEETYGVRR